MRSLLLWGFALGLGLFGAAALVAPLGWYENLPGASETGPPNNHFIRDIGIAYLTMALVAGMAARWAAVRWPLLLVVVFNTAAHGALHALEQLSGGDHHPFNYLEAGLVYGSVVFAGALVWLFRPRRVPLRVNA
jgi:hypothetical protein